MHQYKTIFDVDAKLSLDDLPGRRCERALKLLAVIRRQGAITFPRPVPQGDFESTLDLMYVGRVILGVSQDQIVVALRRPSRQ